MTSEMILKSDLLDILFEKRNKIYGAYLLRKGYNTRLLQSLGLMLLVVALFTAFAFMPTKKPVVYSIKEICTLGLIKPENPKKEPQKPREQLAGAAKKHINNPYTIPTITNSTLLQNNNRIADSVEVDEGTSTENNTGSATIIGSGGNSNITTVNETRVEPPVTVDKNIPLEVAEVKPQFPGGMAALKKFLENNLSSPAEIEPGENVEVQIKMVVGYDGKLKNFETVKDGGYQFNNEVIRVLKKMPNWIPGKSKGENVSVYYIIPVKFVPLD